MIHTFLRFEVNPQKQQKCVPQKQPLYSIKYAADNNCLQNINDNESTAGADASVEMSKLHNIKLLVIAYTHIVS